MAEMKLYLIETEDKTFDIDNGSILCTVTVDKDNKSDNLCRIEAENGDFTEFEYTDCEYFENDEGVYLYLENDPVTYTFRDKPFPFVVI